MSSVLLGVLDDRFHVSSKVRMGKEALSEYIHRSFKIPGQTFGYDFLSTIDALEEKFKFNILIFSDKGFVRRNKNFRIKEPIVCLYTNNFETFQIVKMKSKKLFKSKHPVHEEMMKFYYSKFPAAQQFGGALEKEKEEIKVQEEIEEDEEIFLDEIELTKFNYVESDDQINGDEDEEIFSLAVLSGFQKNDLKSMLDPKPQISIREKVILGLPLPKRYTYVTRIDWAPANFNTCDIRDDLYDELMKFNSEQTSPYTFNSCTGISGQTPQDMEVYDLGKNQKLRLHGSFVLEWLHEDDNMRGNIYGGDPFCIVGILKGDTIQKTVDIDQYLKNIADLHNITVTDRYSGDRIKGKITERNGNIITVKKAEIDTANLRRFYFEEDFTDIFFQSTDKNVKSLVDIVFGDPITLTNELQELTSMTRLRDMYDLLTEFYTTKQIWNQSHNKLVEILQKNIDNVPEYTEQNQNTTLKIVSPIYNEDEIRGNISRYIVLKRSIEFKKNKFFEGDIDYVDAEEYIVSSEQLRELDTTSYSIEDDIKNIVTAVIGANYLDFNVILSKVGILAKYYTTKFVEINYKHFSSRVVETVPKEFWLEKQHYNRMLTDLQNDPLLVLAELRKMSSIVTVAVLAALLQLKLIFPLEQVSANKIIKYTIDKAIHTVPIIEQSRSPILRIYELILSNERDVKNSFSSNLERFDLFLDTSNYGLDRWVNFRPSTGVFIQGATKTFDVNAFEKIHPTLRYFDYFAERGMKLEPFPEEKADIQQTVDREQNILYTVFDFKAIEKSVKEIVVSYEEKVQDVEIPKQECQYNFSWQVLKPIFWRLAVGAPPFAQSSDKKVAMLIDEVKNLDGLPVEKAKIVANCVLDNLLTIMDNDNVVLDEIQKVIDQQEIDVFSIRQNFEKLKNSSRNHSASLKNIDIDHQIMNQLYGYGLQNVLSVPDESAPQVIESIKEIDVFVDGVEVSEQDEY